MNGHQEEKKIFIVGDGGTGKTIFVNALVGHAFQEKYECTMTGWSEIREIRVTVGTTHGTIPLTIFDAPTETTPEYYNGISAAVIMYDVTNRMSFKNTPDWNDRIEYAGYKNIPIALVGNKCDDDSQRKVKADGRGVFRNWKGKDNVEKFFCSAKDPSPGGDANYGSVFKVLEHLLRKMCNQPDLELDGVITFDS